jgi:hypothetical protein
MPVLADEAVERLVQAPAKTPVIAIRPRIEG